MRENFGARQESTLRTECGREFSNIFKAVKLMRDEKHCFHVVYKTYSDEYIYSFCNPFQEEDADFYRVISEAEAKRIFLPKLSGENARELFGATAATFTRLHA